MIESSQASYAEYRVVFSFSARGVKKKAEGVQGEEGFLLKLQV